MIVEPIPHGLDLLKSELVRSPGLHASDIYNDLYAALEPKRYKYDGPPNPLLLALGTAWERHMEYLLTLNGVKYERPPEQMSPEGIAYSPDLLLYNGVTRLGELKVTSMSADDMPTAPCSTLPHKLSKYNCQMKLYAYWLGVTEGWLAILFLYKAYNPDMRVFNLTWTQQELAENHQMLMNHARHKGLLK